MPTCRQNRRNSRRRAQSNADRMPLDCRHLIRLKPAEIRHSVGMSAFLPPDTEIDANQATSSQ